MDLQKIAVKFFAETGGSLPLDGFIPVFHRWIQKHAVEGLLIDVADYGHLEQSPGVMLVGHDADYAMDAMEGPLGLLYNRKGASAGRLSDRICTAFRAALGACMKLENEPEFQGRLRFRAGDALFIANDRLQAPNTDETFQALRPDLASALARIYPGSVDLTRDSTDPRQRLTVRIKAAQPADAASLLARLA